MQANRNHPVGLFLFLGYCKKISIFLQISEKEFKFAQCKNESSSLDC